MSKVIIRKGNHYPCNPFQVGFLPIVYFKFFTLKRDITFTPESKYDLPYPDNLDINKLFGFSFGHHHENSYRFGWNYNKDNDCFEIYSYIYENGKRDFIKIADVEQSLKLTYELSYFNGKVTFNIYECNKNNIYVLYRSTFINVKTNKRIGYTLGSYFGGNCVAPKKIEYLQR